MNKDLSKLLKSKQEKKSMSVVELNKQAKPQYKFVPYMGPLVDFCSLIDFTGSRVICNPPPKDTDLDILCGVFYLDKWKSFHKNTTIDGWDATGEYGGSVSYKKEVNGDIVNLIVVDSPESYNNWLKATILAKNLNLLNKADRITLFNAIVKGYVKDYKYKSDPDKYLTAASAKKKMGVTTGFWSLNDAPKPAGADAIYAALYGTPSVDPTPAPVETPANPSVNLAAPDCNF